MLKIKREYNFSLSIFHLSLKIFAGKQVSVHLYAHFYLIEL